METNQIFISFKEFALSLVSSTISWEKIVLDIEIQPFVFGMSAHCILSNGTINYLDPKFSKEVKLEILKLHQNTIGKKGENKWNRLKLNFNKNGTFETIYEWDTIWQAEVDGFNIEAEQEDPNYKAPKWFWEMDDKELS